MTLPTARLADVLADVKSGFACGEDSPGGVFQFRMNNITTRGTLDLSKRRRVPRSVRRIDSYVLCPGDVLFNATNSPELVGKSAYFPGIDEPAVFSNHFLRLRPDPDRLDGRYFAHWLNVQFQRGVFGGMCRQWVNQATVGRESLLALRVPLPALIEQRRIAEVLDRAEALRAKRRAALALAGALPQAVFADLFGNETSVLTQWKAVALGSLLEFVTSGSRGWAAHYSDEGDLFLRIQNVGRDELLLDDVAYVRTPVTAEATRTRVQPGDVLLSITADLGRTAVVPEGLGAAFINQHLSILRTRSLLPRFLSAYLSSPAGQRQITRRNRHGVKAGLNFDDIKSLNVPVPPIELQRDFVRRVTLSERLRQKYLASLATLDTLFVAAQHRAFRGEL